MRAHLGLHAGRGDDRAAAALRDRRAPEDHVQPVAERRRVPAAARRPSAPPRSRRSAPPPHAQRGRLHQPRVGADGVALAEQEQVAGHELARWARAACAPSRTHGGRGRGHAAPAPRPRSRPRLLHVAEHGVERRRSTAITIASTGQPRRALDAPGDERDRRSPPAAGRSADPGTAPSMRRHAGTGGADAQLVGPVVAPAGAPPRRRRGRVDRSRYRRRRPPPPPARCAPSGRRAARRPLARRPRRSCLGRRLHRHQHVGAALGQHLARRAAQHQLLQRMTALAAHDDEVAVLRALLLRDQRPRIAALGRQLAQPFGRQAGLRGQRGEPALRLGARSLLRIGPIGRTGVRRAARLGPRLDRMHQHQRRLGRDAIGEAHRIQAPRRQVHRHQHAPIGRAHRLPHHQHRPLGEPGDALGGGADDDAAHQPGAARAGHEQPGIELLGQTDDDVRHRNAGLQMLDDAHAVTLRQLDGQRVQLRAGVGFARRARNRHVNQREPRIVPARHARGALDGVLRWRRQVGGGNDVRQRAQDDSSRMGGPCASCPSGGAELGCRQRVGRNCASTQRSEDGGMAIEGYRMQTLGGFVGKALGVSAWVQIDQARIDPFAECTGDHQWIRVDPSLLVLRLHVLAGLLHHCFIVGSRCPATRSERSEATRRPAQVASLRAASNPARRRGALRREDAQPRWPLRSASAVSRIRWPADRKARRNRPAARRARTSRRPRSRRPARTISPPVHSAREGHHQAVRERPALAAVVAQVAPPARRPLRPPRGARTLRAIRRPRRSRPAR